MMIITSPVPQQDTIRTRNIVRQDSLVEKPDTAAVVAPVPGVDSIKPVVNKKTARPVVKVQDTTSVCTRNSIADVTYYNTGNFILATGQESFAKFPFSFIDRTREIKKESKTSLVKQLKPGQQLPDEPFHQDWITGIILLAAFLYSLMRTASGDVLPGATRFLLFRPINDPASRDSEKMFHWQSALQNLLSFMGTGLFVYHAVLYFNVNTAPWRGITLWVLFVGIIIAAVTLRHIACYLTGYISGERELFKEYVSGIYLSYRLVALIHFLLVILISYTTILPEGILISTGIIVFFLMYLIRVVRLVMIFITRNISIFYLILYLCGLEILPVLISVKYFTGLI